jgi:hypothetical protein
MLNRQVPGNTSSSRYPPSDDTGPSDYKILEHFQSCQRPPLDLGTEEIIDGRYRQTFMRSESEEVEANDREEQTYIIQETMVLREGVGK